MHIVLRRALSCHCHCVCERRCSYRIYLYFRLPSLISRPQSRAMLTERKSKVCYFYDGALVLLALFLLPVLFWAFETFENHAVAENVASYYYGGGHPMKPHRLRMTHNLLLSYGLYKKMEVYVSFERLF